jgi:hypothetical protein
MTDPAAPIKEAPNTNSPDEEVASTASTAAGVNLHSPPPGLTAK